MVSIIISWVFYQVLLPLTLLGSVIFRYNVFSSIYLILLLVYPYVPSLSHGSKERCLRFVFGPLITSLIFILAQIGFQIALLASPPYGSLAGEKCSNKEKLLGYFGLESFASLGVGDILRFILPDIVTFVVSVCTVVLIKRITQPTVNQIQQESIQPTEEHDGTESTAAQTFELEESSDTKTLAITKIGLRNGAIIFLTLITMALAGIANPSLFSGFYLLMFMILMTVWAFHGKMLSDRIAWLRVFVSFVAAADLILLFYYQIEFFRDAFPASSIGARLMGLTPFVNISCNSSQLVLSQGITWTEFISPPLTLLMYWTLAWGVAVFFTSDKTRMHAKKNTQRRRQRKADEKLVRTTVLEVKADENVQPLVEEEETPTTYDAIEQPGTSTARVSEEPAKVKMGFLHTVSIWISKLKLQSFYVLALVIMMAWSVTLHSWLTFILLVASCVLWLLRNRSWAVLCCSPYITTYAMALVCLQFIYSLNLTEDELPTIVHQADNSSFNLSSFGILHYYNMNPSLYLGAQILYTCVFWFVLHQYVYIRRHRDEFDSTTESISKIVQASHYLKRKLSKYWILVVYSFLIIMATDGKPSGMKMIYALALVLSGFVFEIDWNIWSKCLATFLYFLMVYTMVVLLLIYTFQFQEFPGYWRSFTGFNDEQLGDLGLIKYKTTGELFLRIFIPTLFLLTVIFQNHYFNQIFLKLVEFRVKSQNINPVRSQPNAESDGSQESMEMQNLGSGNCGDVVAKQESKLSIWAAKLWNAFLEFWYGLVRLVWRLLEFHMWKLLVITVLVSALQQATAIYFVLFAVWVVFISARCGSKLLYLLTSAYVGLLVLACMFFQLSFIQGLKSSNLTYECPPNSADNKTYNILTWIGFTDMASNTSFFYHAQGLMSILIMLAFERVVTWRQDWRRVYRREAKLHHSLTALYPSINHAKADDNMLSCCKYLVNYWFYKFGVEACYIMAVITIWLRADAFGVIYSALFVAAMLLRNRKPLARFWNVYTFVLMAILLCEYAIALGMPPVWCGDGHQYPWTTFEHTTPQIRNRLVRWLYLPDYLVPPISRNLIVDVFQLLFILCQLNVFHFERTQEALVRGGDNGYLTPHHLDIVAESPADNPKKNFMTRESRNILDQVKVAVFQYSFWLTVAFIFFAGTSTISLFCMGYLFAFFYLMTKHQSLLTDKPSKLLRIWNIVLGYNVSVIIIKVSLQITSCVYNDILEQKACVFIQLMNLVCSKPGEYDGLAGADHTCALPGGYVNAGLTWDFICFLFLLIQRRIFQSYYFLHTAQDMRISMDLASRGAELLREKLIADVEERNKTEDETLSEIRENMAQIRKKYINIGRGELVYHTDAMRAGDYYMFADDDSDKEEDKEPKDKDIKNPLQMIHRADAENIDKALEEREEDKRRLERDEHDKIVPKETFEGKSVDGSVADDEEEKKKRGFIKKGLIFVWELMMSGVDWLTLRLNTMNCVYRNIALQLASEKDVIAQEKLKQQRSESPTTKIMIESPDRTDDNDGKTSQLSPQNDFIPLKPMDFDKDQMRGLRLFYALWYTIAAHTDILCYFLVILNLMLSASVMSLVLPIAIFLWSTLSTPRPTRRFWTFCIYYLEVIILIKFLFQFEFYPWNAAKEANTQVNNPFWWPRIIGIEQKDKWSSLELLQLLAFFFHKQMLQIQGIWDKASKADGTEDNSQTTENEEAQPSTSKDVSVKKASSKSDQNDDREGDTDEKPSRLQRMLTSPYRFYNQLLHQPYSAVTDVYIFIFLCDVIDFIIIIFGYWAFGKYASNAADVVSNISSNKVPTGFLVMLIVQFTMMFIDRALYLRKNLTGKLIFYVALVIGVHVWMFFVLPYINGRPFYVNHVAQTWYFFKAVYFLLSAYQIRCGYPKKVLGNFLTKAYGTPNLFLFKGYRAIPFLAELTAIMDWMFVDTTMGVGEWFKFHAIYAEVFELKCWRVFEKDYPSPRGIPKSKFIKYFVGGLLVFFLIAIIWFPLLFMNIALTIGGVPNNPSEFSVQITANAFEPLFQVAADSNSISIWNSERFKGLTQEFAADPTAALFLSSYTASQVASIQIDGQSKTIWGISPPQREKLLNKLSNSSADPVMINFEWTISRNPDTSSVVTSTGNRSVYLTRNDPSRVQLFNLLQTPGVVGAPAKIVGLFPKYIHANLKAVSTAATKLYSSDTSKLYVDTNLDIRYDRVDNLTSWWQVSEGGNPSLEIVVFSDKASSSSLSFLVGYGIIGLYVSIVLVVGRFVRSALIGNTNTIMFQELPRVEKVLQLCLDIYLVREEREFQLEEDLYAKLIFLYRSPETMITKTRPKQD